MLISRSAFEASVLFVSVLLAVVVLQVTSLHMLWVLDEFDMICQSHISWYGLGIIYLRMVHRMAAATGSKGCCCL